MGLDRAVLDENRRRGSRAFDDQHSNAIMIVEPGLYIHGVLTPEEVAIGTLPR